MKGGVAWASQFESAGGGGTETVCRRHVMVRERTAQGKGAGVDNVNRHGPLMCPGRDQPGTGQGPGGSRGDGREVRKTGREWGIAGRNSDDPGDDGGWPCGRQR